jgi:hypothetical protein
MTERHSENQIVGYPYGAVSREIRLGTGRIVDATTSAATTRARPHHFSETASVEYEPVRKTDDAVVGDVCVADISEPLMVDVELTCVRHLSAVVLDVDLSVTIGVRRNVARVVRIAAGKNLKAVQEAVTIGVGNQWVGTCVVWIHEVPRTGLHGVQQPVLIIIKITHVPEAIKVGIGLLKVIVGRAVVADVADAISIAVRLIAIRCETTVVVAVRDRSGGARKIPG